MTISVGMLRHRFFYVCRRYFSEFRRQRGLLNKEIGIVGAPFNKGQSNLGVEKGPQAIRNFGLLDGLKQLNYIVYDYGDLKFEHFDPDPPYKTLKHPNTVAKAAKKISETVSKVLKDDRVCITLGGDHSVALGTFHGHTQIYPDACLIWVDAHADINTAVTTYTGHIHGMPLSFHIHEMKKYCSQIPGFEWLNTSIHAKDVAILGIRDVDPGERYILEKFGICYFSMHDIDKYGMNFCIDRSVDAINPNGDRPIHLSFDIDSLDPDITPSTGTRVPGGLTLREGIYLAESIAKTGKVNAVDIVEVNPDIGSKRDCEKTLYAATQILLACFGRRRDGILPPSDYSLPLAESQEK